EKALAAVAEASIAVMLAQRPAQRVEAVFGADDAAQIARHLALREDGRAILLVELQHLTRSLPQRQTHGDDAAGRGAGNEIEIVMDGLAQPILDLGQKRRGKHAFDAAAVNGENS